MPIAKIFAHAHPVLVHFPIALTVVAVLFEWIALGRRKPVYSTSMRGMLIVALAGAALAVFSGLALRGDDDVTFDGDGLLLIERHEQFGIAAGCAVLAIVVAGEIQRRKSHPAMKALYVLVLHAAVALVGYAAALGGASHWGVDWLPW